MPRLTQVCYTTVVCYTDSVMPPVVTATVTVPGSFVTIPDTAPESFVPYCVGYDT